jgi:hypothetical protein
VRSERERRVLPHLLSGPELVCVGRERERWLEERPDVHGYVMSLPEAIDAGRAVFGDMLADPPGLASTAARS